ncbi:DUF3021 domain-containing protein [Secundilactobacillus hailunensis]|uniref:DUF3021 domain-containing protein n=1 Tax=Secundilactobacillus hailunensis TaxID=2559923 RepID=A0ABW1T8N4_9LACO|nr:DUF3021 domain-containing protein [Secundilactobacillus hailunensis]
MKIISHTISGAAAGITIGFLLALSFSLLNHTTVFMSSTPDFINQFPNSLIATIASAGLWALMGIVFDVGSYLIFETQWSITRQTIVHFIVTFALFTPLALLAGWFPVQSYLIFYFIEFVIIYIIVWFISMQIAKQKVQRLNQLVDKAKK